MWCEVCGVWCVACGGGCVVWGVWCVMCGVRCEVVCGVWCAECCALSYRQNTLNTIGLLLINRIVDFILSLFYPCLQLIGRKSNYYITELKIPECC